MPNLFPIMIGNFEIQGFAAPERIPYGGTQRLGVHQLPGGIRVIDSMGSDDHDLSIKGQLINGLGVDSAVEAARQLDYLRKQGAPINVSWDVYAYICVIETFSPVYEYQSRIVFDMILKVVIDLTAPVQTQSQNQIDSLISADMGNTLSSAQSVGMNVPSSSASAFSTTSGSQSPGPTAITWDPQDFYGSADLPSASANIPGTNTAAIPPGAAASIPGTNTATIPPANQAGQVIPLPAGAGAPIPPSNTGLIPPGAGAPIPP